MSRLSNGKNPLYFAALLAIVVLLTMSCAMVGCGSNSSNSPPPGNPLIGTQAPDFSLKVANDAGDDDVITLSKFVGEGPVVIIFHLGLHCEHCVHQLQEYAGDMREFDKAGIRVIAISPQTVRSIQEVIPMHDPFPFPLLADEDEKVFKAYDLMTPDGGKHALYLVDQNRRILFAESGNDPVDKMQEVLELGKKAQQHP